MKKGDLIIIPTDTVYGLCAMLFDEVALEKIYAIKGRQQTKQIPILVSSIEEAKTIAEISKDAHTIMQSFWPGALTIVLETNAAFKMKTGEQTVALRMPNHPLALEMLKKCGPLRATSVNYSGELPLIDINDIRHNFEKHVSKIYEQTEQPSNVSSTVIDMTSGLKVLRQGTITLNDLNGALQK